LNTINAIHHMFENWSYIIIIAIIINGTITKI
jgi:hypothetical protein